MNKKLINSLICPISQSDLELIIFSQSSDLENKVETGLLVSSDTSGLMYPIFNGIPRLLKNSISIFRDEIEQNLDKIPNELLERLMSELERESRIEQDLLQTQASFSSEWDEIGDQANAWGRSPETRLEEFLSRTQMQLHDLKGMKILDAGCGNGEIEIALRDSGSEIFAVDLSYSLDQVKQKLDKTEITNDTKIHLIQGDVLNIPIKNSKFDLVFSDGVIHHTESVYKGLEELSSKLKESGKCFVFVYSHDHKNYFDKSLYNFFRFLRSITLRIPHKILHLLCYFLSPFHFTSVRIANALLGKERFKKRTIKETEISLFDALSPVYDWRTSFHNLSSWYSELGFEEIRKTYFSHVGIGVLGTLKKPKN